MGEWCFGSKFQISIAILVIMTLSGSELGSRGSKIKMDPFFFVDITNQEGFNRNGSRKRSSRGKNGHFLFAIMALGPNPSIGETLSPIFLHMHVAGSSFMLSMLLMDKWKLVNGRANWEDKPMER